MSSALLCASFMLAASPVYGASLDYEAGKMFRKIGISSEQAEPYALVYEKFLKSRNSQVRRALNNSTGGDQPVMAKKRARRAAKKSVKKMGAVLTEHQLEYYEQYLDLANKVFLRDAGLR
jgi:hypothetical protein